MLSEIELVFALATLGSDGVTYTQNFDAMLGSDGGNTGTSLLVGWSANNNRTHTSAITEAFPPASVTFATFNAGGRTDRTLATGNDDSTGENQLQFSAAVRVAFSVEAWAGNLNEVSPGEAAYVVDLEVDRTGSGVFGRIFAFNDGAKITTGLTLAPGLLDGNSDVDRTMFDSGLVELQEAIPAGSTIRLTFDAQTCRPDARLHLRRRRHNVPHRRPRRH